MPSIIEAAGAYLAGVISGFGFAIAREALSDATKRKEAALHVISIYGRMKERLASDAVTDLDGEMSSIAKYHSYFGPQHRISRDLAFLRQVYDYARQSWKDLDQQGIGGRREQVAGYIRELEAQGRTRALSYYLGSAPLYRPL